MMIWGTKMLLLDTNGNTLYKNGIAWILTRKGQHLGPKIYIFLLCSQVPKNLTCPNVVFIS
jgi:hypothetical protein